MNREESSVDTERFAQLMSSWDAAKSRLTLVLVMIAIAVAIAIAMAALRVPFQPRRAVVIVLILMLTGLSAYLGAALVAVSAALREPRWARIGLAITCVYLPWALIVCWLLSRKVTKAWNTAR